MASPKRSDADHLAEHGDTGPGPTAAAEPRTQTGRGLIGLTRRQPLSVFFVLAFAISWLPYPFYVFGLLPGPLFLPFGPLIAAVTVIAITEGKRGLRQLGSRMLRWRVRWWLWAVALGLPLAVLATSTALTVQVWGAPTVSWSGVPWLSFVAAFALRLVNPLDGPLGEEPGWRGYALPKLFITLSPLAAASVLGLIVTAWHLPLVLMGMLSPFGLPATFAITFVYTWLFNRTGGSVLLTLIFHNAEGCVQVSQLGLTGEFLSRQAALYALCWLVVALLLVLVDRKAWRSASPAATADH